MGSNGTEQLMTVGEVAYKLRVKVRTVYNWVSRNEIPYVKVGTALRFRPSEIDNWMVSHREPSGEPKEVA